MPVIITPRGPDRGRCEICHHSFGRKVPASHYETSHPGFLQWAAKYHRRILYPISGAVAIGWLLEGVESAHYLPAELYSAILVVFLLTTLAFVIALALYSRGIRRFRKEWRANNPIHHVTKEALAKQE
jgi:hypothetical protein